MRVLDPVVEQAAGCLQIRRAELPQCSPIRREPVGDDLLRLTVSAHEFPEEIQCRLLIPTFGHNRLEDFAFAIDRAPKIMPFAVDLHEDLVEVPSPVGKCPHTIDALAPDLGREHRAEPVPPEPDRLVADLDPALVQQIFDIDLLPSFAAGLMLMIDWLKEGRDGAEEVFT